MKKIITAFIFIGISFMFSQVRAEKVKDTCKIKKDIPLDLKGNPIYGYNLRYKTANQLHLDSLNNGFDSLQIRIWAVTSEGIRKVVVLKVSNHKWLGELVTYCNASNAGLTKLNIIKLSVTNIEPSLGWQAFFNSINKLEITTLPDMSKIPNYPIGADGYYYSFEIATSKYYRFYEYWIPEVFKNKFSEANKVAGIIAVVETAFHIKLR